MREAMAMSCAEAMALLQDYLKRELTPELTLRLTAHLDRCQGCFVHLRFERNFVARLQVHVTASRCPDALRRRILHSLRAE